MTDPQSLPLRDIHLPPAPPWWPPAPGWWLLLACALAGIAIGYWVRRHNRRSALKDAQLELAALRERAVTDDARTLLKDISVLLRRIAISRFPREEVAGVTGEAWLQFLDRDLDGAPFTSGAGRILLDGPYRREVRNVELTPLLDLCGQWIAVLARPAKGRTT